MEKSELFLINNWQAIICGNKCDKTGEGECDFSDTSCPFHAQAQKIEALQDKLTETIQEELGSECLQYFM